MHCDHEVYWFMFSYSSIAKSISLEPSKYTCNHMDQGHFIIRLWTPMSAGRQEYSHSQMPAFRTRRLLAIPAYGDIDSSLKLPICADGTLNAHLLALSWV
jgi:hypothetical protein